MYITELKTVLIPVLENWIKHLYNSAKEAGKTFKEEIGFGEYVLINRLENHFSIELLGFQNISTNPIFVVEDKPNTSDLNFFINGGKKFEEYNGLKPIIDGTNAHNLDAVYSFADLLMSVSKIENVLDVLFDDVSKYGNGLIKEDCDLPFHFLSNSTNIFLNNIAIVSQVDGVYSFRRHATTIIVHKEITIEKFRALLNKLFDIKHYDITKSPVGIKFRSQIISELKSLAYHKVDETAIDKFIQLISEDFAKALGYISSKSNVRLEIKETSKSGTEKQFLTPDFMMEKEDGTYDILDLKLGLLSANFAFGDWTNSYFSSYAQKLLGQLAGYRRYFSNPENATWAKDNLGIVVDKPKLIGIAGNHNNFDREIVNTALEGNIDDFNLISYNELTDLLKK
ncbi:hypothetical protein [Aquimarina brevivitae]|uniref:hypothetical protein n=1 Tax=Aquimarina brevivitae TaxID=323412 RepID=UPI0010297848|nr:hypothetical protein [Aquimarina brevivitae]